MSIFPVVLTSSDGICELRPCWKCGVRFELGVGVGGM